MVKRRLSCRYGSERGKLYPKGRRDRPEDFTPWQSRTAQEKIVLCAQIYTMRIIKEVQTIKKFSLCCVLPFPGFLDSGFISIQYLPDQFGNGALCKRFEYEPLYSLGLRYALIHQSAVASAKDNGDIWPDL